MHDLKTSLRAYVDQTIERVDAEDVVRRSSLTPERRWWHRPIASAVFAAAAAAVLVVGTVVAIEIIESGQMDSGTVSSTTVSSSTTTADTTATTDSAVITTPTSAPVPPLSWQEARVEGADNASIASVAVGDGYLVAVGERTLSDSTDEYQADAAVWVSVDGLSWMAVDDQSFKGLKGDDADGVGLFDRNQAMFDVAAGPLGVVAVGTDEDVAAIWTSSDARTWTQVVDDRLAAAASAGWFTEVVAGGPGWMAVGTGPDGGWIWVSSDGVEWTVVTDPFSDVEMGEPVALSGISISGEQVVVTGRIGFADPAPSRNAIWVSTDGLDWELVASGEVPPLAISGSLDGTTLIGFAEVPLISSDGIMWTPGRAPSPPATAHVVFADSWALAAGFDFWASTWLSEDGGVTWTKALPDVPGFSDSSWTTDLAPVGDDIVIVGTLPSAFARGGLGNAMGSTAKVWIATWAGS